MVRTITRALGTANIHVVRTKMSPKRNALSSFLNEENDLYSAVIH